MKEIKLQFESTEDYNKFYNEIIIPSINNGDIIISEEDANQFYVKEKFIKNES